MSTRKLISLACKPRSTSCSPKIHRSRACCRSPNLVAISVAVLRAELGDVQRFARTDEVIAYSGMDIEIKESGVWKGRAKLSKRGSGPARDACSTWQRCAAFT